MDKEAINNLFEKQISMASKVRSSDYKSRIDKVESIVNWIYKNQHKIKTALHKDLGKPELETNVAEIWVAVDLAKNIVSNLKDWMKPNRVSSTLPVLLSKSYIKYYPKGVCLILAPWKQYALSNAANRA